MKGLKRLAMGLIFGLVVAGSLGAQTGSTPSGSLPGGVSPAGTSPAGTKAPVNPLPEPYGLDEFPAWAHSLRRFEIVSLGAFPILLFYSRVALDMGRFVGNGFDASYAPWPFRNEFSYKPRDNEQWLAVSMALGLSLGVGTLDYLLVSRRKARQYIPVDTGLPDSLRP